MVEVYAPSKNRPSAFGLRQDSPVTANAELVTPVVTEEFVTVSPRSPLAAFDAQYKEGSARLSKLIAHYRVNPQRVVTFKNGETLDHAQIMEELRALEKARTRQFIAERANLIRQARVEIRVLAENAIVQEFQFENSPETVGALGLKSVAATLNLSEIPEQTANSPQIVEKPSVIAAWLAVANNFTIEKGQSLIGKWKQVAASVQTKKERLVAFASQKYESSSQWIGQRVNAVGANVGKIRNRTVIPAFLRSKIDNSEAGNVAKSAPKASDSIWLPSPKTVFLAFKTLVYRKFLSQKSKVSHVRPSISVVGQKGAPLARRRNLYAILWPSAAALMMGSAALSLLVAPTPDQSELQVRADQSRPTTVEKAKLVFSWHTNAAEDFPDNSPVVARTDPPKLTAALTTMKARPESELSENENPIPSFASKPVFGPAAAAISMQVARAAHHARAATRAVSLADNGLRDESRPRIHKPATNNWKMPAATITRTDVAQLFQKVAPSVGTPTQYGRSMTTPNMWVVEDKTPPGGLIGLLVQDLSRLSGAAPTALSNGRSRPAATSNSPMLADVSTQNEIGTPGPKRTRARHRTSAANIASLAPSKG